MSEQEAAWAAKVGRRLRAELTGLISALPAHERTGPGLERVLGINRAVAYRLIAAASEEGDLELLTRAPGVEGIKMFAASSREKIGSPVLGLLAGVEAAIADFQALIRSSGGSHARLIARVRATTDSLSGKKVNTPPGRREDVRRAMHDVIRALSGRKIVARMSVSVVRPNPDMPGQIEYAHARAFVGYQAISGGLPLVLGSWATRPGNDNRSLPVTEYQTLHGTPLNELDGGGLIAEFCTSPLPIVTTRDTTGNLVQVIDQSRSQPGTPIDATTAYRLPTVGPLPVNDNPPIFLEVTSLTVPAERMVADLYVHHSIAGDCTPSVNLYLGRGSGGCDVIDRWHEQIDGAPVVGLLGRGLRNAHSSGWDLHANLSSRVFEILGWNANEFVGFRCDEAWPLWNCDYVMTLDYRKISPAGEPD